MPPAARNSYRGDPAGKHKSDARRNAGVQQQRLPTSRGMHPSAQPSVSSAAALSSSHSGAVRADSVQPSAKPAQVTVDSAALGCPSRIRHLKPGSALSAVSRSCRRSAIAFTATTDTATRSHMRTARLPGMRRGSMNASLPVTDAAKHSRLGTQPRVGARRRAPIDTGAMSGRGSAAHYRRPATPTARFSNVTAGFATSARSLSIASHPA